MFKITITLEEKDGVININRKHDQITATDYEYAFGYALAKTSEMAENILLEIMGNGTSVSTNNTVLHEKLQKAMTAQMTARHKRQGA